MATRGPKKKPPAKEKAQGNPGHRTSKKGAKKAVSGASAASSGVSTPDWLDAAARAVWSLYKPKLDLLGYMRETDTLAFARYCDHTSRWLRLREKVDTKGESYWTKSKHGRMLRANPDFRAMLALEDRMRQLEDRFGLSPISREQVLARMNEPTTPALIVAQPGAAASGMPTSPSSMLSPAAFAKTPAAGGTH